MELKNQIIKLAKQAKEASYFLANLSSQDKDKVLSEMAKALAEEKEFILRENKKDVEGLIKKKASASFIDRLMLSEKRIQEMSDSLKELVHLKDPVGSEIKSWVRPNGLMIRKVRVPIGVIAIIYESRPNVTSECIGLCLKSGNSVILKGGSDALHSNSAIFQVLNKVLRKNNFLSGSAILLETKQRSAIDILLKLNGYIDLVIPRGGEGLIKKVTENSLVPVIKHYKGICHVYVDDMADLNMAEVICYNAKVQRPGVCNAMETMLVHKDVAMRFLPGMIKKFREAGVQIRGCDLTYKIARGAVKLAKPQDYRTEYLDLILSVKVVGDIQEAIEHINNFGSHHSDAIVTDDENNAREFGKRVDSACVYVNASTRFTDGYQFGFGAEIGISTDKLHARGPMALEELTTYKYLVFGTGQIRT